MTHDDNRLNDVAAMQILGPRERQEDSALHVRLGRGRLIVVADGMGGEPAGHIASMAAVLGFEKGFGAPADGFQNNLTWAGRFMDGLAGALDAMNAAVEEGRGSYGMATTLAAVEGALSDGEARDNTTAIAIRTSVEWMRKYGRFEDYEPVTSAPDREVLGPELPEGAVL